jgi:lipopolysaccharide transport system ATP-binding protein
MSGFRKRERDLLMFSENIAIRVANLSKRYEIYDVPRDRLKQFVVPRMQRLVGQPPKQYYSEFWALKDVSFEVEKGETVGIIGCNGSGKSTLLQIICGTLTPTNGTVETHGRIAALLELGSGFNPEFTGRENVYLNAAVLGLSTEEIDQRFDDIMVFADIGKFIEQPVKTYSSGMVMRLAFAVQSQIAPDILIVDEALSVGDAKFQAKCFERLRQLKDNGTSILLVSHSSEQIVTHCSKAILLNSGVQLETGEPRWVVNCYLDLLFGKEKKSLTDPVQQLIVQTELSGNNDVFQLSHQQDIFATRPGYNPHEYRWGDGSVSILDFYYAVDGESYPSAITTGQTVCLSISIQFYRDLVRPILGITIKTKEGVTVYGVNSDTLKRDDFHVLGQLDSVVEVETFFACRLAPGDYFISLGIATRQGEEVIPHDRRYDAIHLQVRPDSSFFGLTDLELNLSVRQVVS